jgi:hypothetical protein
MAASAEVQDRRRGPACRRRHVHDQIEGSSTAGSPSSIAFRAALRAWPPLEGHRVHHVETQRSVRCGSTALHGVIRTTLPRTPWQRVVPGYKPRGEPRGALGMSKGSLGGARSARGARIPAPTGRNPRGCDVFSYDLVGRSMFIRLAPVRRVTLALKPGSRTVLPASSAPVRMRFASTRRSVASIRTMREDPAKASQGGWPPRSDVRRYYGWHRLQVARFDGVGTSNGNRRRIIASRQP